MVIYKETLSGRTVAINKSQILKKAQSYMAKGQMDKAILEWQKLLSETPNDGNIYNTIGDLFLKKKDTQQSIESFIRAADVFHESGFDLKTIAVYKKILKINPKQHEVYLKLGDLNAERGLTGNAISDYLIVAKKHTEDKNIRDAIDIYRKIANLDPKNTEIRLKLAEMSLKEGFQKEAITEYLELAKIYNEMGKVEDGQKVYHHILKIDAENQEAKVGLEEIPVATKPTSPEGQTEEPQSEADVLLSRAEKAFESGNFDQARRLYQDLAAADPANPSHQEKVGILLLKQKDSAKAFPPMKAAAELYIDKGKIEHAVELMKKYLDIDPSHVDAHMFLGIAYEKEGNKEKAIGEYIYIVDKSVAADAVESARSLYEKVKAMDPGHGEVKRLHPVFEREASKPALKPEIPQPGMNIESSQPVPAPKVEQVELSQPISSSDSSSQANLPNTIKTLLETPFAGEDSAEILDPGSPSNRSADQGTINDLFVEAEVYLKYGLIDKAIDQLKKVISIGPDHVESHSRLKETLETENRKAEAADVAISLASIMKARGEPDEYNRYMEEARALNPDNPRLKDQQDLEKVIESDGMQEIMTDLDDEALMGVPDNYQEITSSHVEASNKAAVTPVTDSGVHSKAEADITGMWDQEFEPVEGEDQPVEAIESITDVSEPKKEIPETVEVAQESEAEMSFGESLEESISSIEQAPAAEVEMEVAQESEAEMSFGESLEESISSIEQAPVPVVETDQREISLEEELEQTFTSMIGVEKVATSESDTTLSGDETSNLSESNPASDEALRSVISKYHDEDEENIESGEDIETHYNLGIAYSEMGLVNDAIYEFKIASRSADRFVDAQSMLAASYKKKGKSKEAMAALERALSAPQCGEKENEWLSYDLALLHEQEGQLEKALRIYIPIYEKDPAFKDVGKRVETLREKVGTPPVFEKRKASEQDEEVDRLVEKFFDDSLSQDASKNPKTEKKKSRISYL